MADREKWKFTEAQRDDVCNGKLCPSCLCTDVKQIGAAPDGINLNIGYKCQNCGASWEGY